MGAFGGSCTPQHCVSHDQRRRRCCQPCSAGCGQQHSTQQHAAGEHVSRDGAPPGTCSSRARAVPRAVLGAPGRVLREANSLLYSIMMPTSASHAHQLQHLHKSRCCVMTYHYQLSMSSPVLHDMTKRNNSPNPGAAGRAARRQRHCIPSAVGPLGHRGPRAAHPQLHQRRQHGGLQPCQRFG